MTARFFRRAISWDDYRAAIDLVPPPGVDAPEPQYNIAPSQLAPIIRRAPEGEYAPRHSIQMAPAFWGLVPMWWNKPLSEKKFSSFNARAETIATSATFSGAFRQGRCLVPASGFYVWSGDSNREGGSTPFAIARGSGDWFCFAGLWSRAMIDGSEFDTFAIVTTDPNDLVAGFSTSMPVILRPAHYLQWLDPQARDPFALLRPYPADAMRAWPAHPAVGNVRNQGEALLGELGPQHPGGDEQED
jgi:putative SOS response-associated peptidase YedK